MEGMEENRINFAKHQLFRCVEELFVCINDLLDPEIDAAMNMKSHGLKEEELLILLFEMFSRHMLVALKNGRGFFTPTLEEIEAALHEDSELLYKSESTFYGLTTGGMEVFRELQAFYGKRI